MVSFKHTIAMAIGGAAIVAGKSMHEEEDQQNQSFENPFVPRRLGQSSTRPRRKLTKSGKVGKHPKKGKEAPTGAPSEMPSIAPSETPSEIPSVDPLECLVANSLSITRLAIEIP